MEQQQSQALRSRSGEYEDLRDLRIASGSGKQERGLARLGGQQRVALVAKRQRGASRTISIPFHSVPRHPLSFAMPYSAAAKAS